VLVSIFFTDVRQVAAVTSKRDELRERFDEALDLKSGIERRRARLDAQLRHCALTADELVDFRLSTDTVCRLRLDEQWIDDRLEIAQRQLAALVDSILASSQGTEC